MPTVLCPVCASTFHLSIRGDPAAWEKEHVTEKTPNGIPLLKCVRCWVELRPGHRVTIREVPNQYAGQLAIGQEGVVSSDKMGAINVTFGEFSASCHREQLFYVSGQPSVA